MDAHEVLRYRWSKKHNDFLCQYPTKSDGALLFRFFGENYMYSFAKELTGKFPYHEIEDIKKELESRGYDLTTLKFSIKKKKIHEEKCQTPK